MTTSRLPKVWAVRPIRVTKPEDLAAAFAQAKKYMAEFSVPVVVEVILERVTNIAMGLEISGVNEFEEVIDLPATIDLTPVEAK